MKKPAFSLALQKSLINKRFDLFSYILHTTLVDVYSRLRRVYIFIVFVMQDIFCFPVGCVLYSFVRKQNKLHTRL